MRVLLFALMTIGAISATVGLSNIASVEIKSDDFRAPNEIGTDCTEKDCIKEDVLNEDGTAKIIEDSIADPILRSKRHANSTCYSDGSCSSATRHSAIFGIPILGSVIVFMLSASYYR